MDWEALKLADSQTVESKLWNLDIANEIAEGLQLNELQRSAEALLELGMKFEKKHSIVLRAWQLLHDIEVLCQGIESSKDALSFFYASLKEHNENADVVSSSCELLCMLANKKMLTGDLVDDTFLTLVISELSSHAHSNPVKRATLSILLTLTRQGHKRMYDNKKILSELLGVLMDILLVNKNEHDIVEAAGIIVYHAMTSKESTLVKYYYNGLVTAVGTILSFEPLPPLSALVPCILMLDIILDGAYDDGHLLEAIPCMIERGLDMMRVLVEHLTAVKTGKKEEGDTEELANHQVCSTLCSTLKIINLAISDADILVLGIDEEDMRRNLEDIRSYLIKTFPVASATEVLKCFPGDSFFIERSASWFAEELSTFRARADGLIGAMGDAHDTELVSTILHQEEGIEQKLHALIAKLDESTGDASEEVAAAAKEAKEEAQEEERKKKERFEKERQERERKAQEARERKAKQELERKERIEKKEMEEKEEKERQQQEMQEKAERLKQKEQERREKKRQEKEKEENKLRLERLEKERKDRERQERADMERKKLREKEKAVAMEKKKEEADAKRKVEAETESKRVQAERKEKEEEVETKVKAASLSSDLDSEAKTVSMMQEASPSLVDVAYAGSDASILALVRCSRVTQEQAHAAVQRADLLQSLFIDATKKLEELSRENEELRSRLDARKGAHRSGSGTPRKRTSSSSSAMGGSSSPSPGLTVGWEQSPFAADVSCVQGNRGSPPMAPPPPPQQPHRFITDGVLTPHGTRALEERQHSLAMGGILKGLQDWGEARAKAQGQRNAADSAAVTSKEALTGAAAAVLRFFELINSQVPSERGSLESVAASTVRKFLGMGIFEKSKEGAHGGLTLQEVDIILSSVGVKQISIFGVAYVLVRCAGKTKHPPVEDVQLVDALKEKLDAFVGAHRKPEAKKNLPAPIVDLNETTTADLHSVRRLLERQTSALLTIFNAYKATFSNSSSTGAASEGAGEVISVEGAVSFALDIGLIPTVISRARFLTILKMSRVLDLDEEPGGAEEVTLDQFKRLIINLALCVPTFASGIDKSRMTATILVSNFLLWMRRRASAWHQKVEHRVSSRGAVSIPVLSFNMAHIRDSSSSVREDDEAERKQLLAVLCGAQHEVRRNFL